MEVKFSNELEFKASLAKFADKLPEEHLLPLQKMVVAEVAEGCIEGTPVDQGRARGGWQIEFNRQVSGETGKLDKEGGATKAAIDAGMLRMRPFDLTYLGNDVPYIVPLEEGHSGQNRGWVKATVAAVNAKFR